MKTITIVAVVLLALVAGYYMFIKPEAVVEAPTLPEVSLPTDEDSEDEVVSADYKDLTFTIEGNTVTMTDGVSVSTDMGGTSTVTYFGNEVEQDLDGDGKMDVAFLVTQNNGGSGTFFYLVGALAREGGYIGTHAAFIGDRIAPQNNQAGTGRIVIVNYADRAEGEPMSADPSVAKSIHFLLDVPSLQFGEVAQNFEGESNI